MPIGDNVIIKDKLIKNTTSKKSNTSNINKESIRRKKEKDTEDTVQMTFYIKNKLLNKLYNFAYWDRHSITKAFNTVLKDGLTGKNTKDKT